MYEPKSEYGDMSFAYESDAYKDNLMSLACKFGSAHA